MKKANVYVVDDDESVADSLVALLGMHGLAARHFPSADLFLRAVGSLEPGCIVLDVFMPGIDGIDALGMLRERGIEWPAIVMTSDSDPIIADFAWVAGAVEFVPKPYVPAILIQKVQTQLRRLEA